MDGMADAKFEKFAASIVDAALDRFDAHAKVARDRSDAFERSIEDMLSCNLAVSALSIDAIAGAPLDGCGQVAKFKERLPGASSESLGELCAMMSRELSRALGSMSQALDANRGGYLRALAELESAVSSEAIRREASASRPVSEKSSRL